jgi:hypothetical protein
MVILAVSIVVAVALAYSFLREWQIDPTLIESRAIVPTVGVQIICGDCAGDGLIPRKTYVDASGKCSECGGKSYILAANRGLFTTWFPANRALASLSEAEARRVWRSNVETEEWRTSALRVS